MNLILETLGTKIPVKINQAILIDSVIKIVKYFA